MKTRQEIIEATYAAFLAGDRNGMLAVMHDDRRVVVEEELAVAPGLTFSPAGAGAVGILLATDIDQLRTGTRRLVETVSQWGTA